LVIPFTIQKQSKCAMSYQSEVLRTTSQPLPQDITWASPLSSFSLRLIHLHSRCCPINKPSFNRWNPDSRSVS
jgi:hypothetical protein